MLSVLFLLGITEASVVLREAGNGEAAILHTDFSISTLEARLGISRTSVPLSLSFIEAGSFLYTTSSCPPFVRCYDGVEDSLLGLAVYLHVGEVSVPLYPFRAQVYVDDIRDTAGALGFGPGSYLAERFRVQLKQQPFAYNRFDGLYKLWGQSLTILNDLASNYTTQSVAVPLVPSARGDSWKIESSVIRLNGDVLGSRPMKIVIDPAISPIVIPHELRSRVRDILELQVSDVLEDPQTGDIYVPCSRDSGIRSTIDLEFTIADHGSFKIYPQANHNPKKRVVGDTYYCQTHLRFGSRMPAGPHDRHTWIMGEPILFNRPQGVIFDSRNNQILVTIPPSRSSATSLETTLIMFPGGVLPFPIRAPRYDPNIVIERPNDSVTVLKFIRKPTDIEDGYVVRSRGLIGGRSLGILDFSLRNIDDLRNRRIAESPAVPGSPSRELDGVFHILDDTGNLRFNETDGSISLFLTKAVSLDIPIYSVKLVQTPSISMISLILVTNPVVDTSSLLLPQPTVIENATVVPDDRDVSCCICMCEFEPGQSVQSLPSPCTHKFHEACIKDWFKTGKRSCPLCQSQVPFAQNPTVVKGASGGAAYNASAGFHDLFALLLGAMDRHDARA